MRPVTAAELRSIELRRPGWGKKGYAPAEAEAFLARAADALDAVAAERTPELTADQVRQVVFRKPPFGRGRGYDEDQVDDVLDAIEHALRSGPAWPGTGTIELNGRPVEQ
jgi:DivIVA domain-containing protein